MNLCVLTKQIWEMYFDGDFEKHKDAVSVLDADCILLGTKKRQILRGADQAIEFLKTARSKETSVHYEYEDFWCEEMPLSDTVRMVYGGASVWWEMPESSIRLDVDSEFTAIFRLVDGQWKLVHINQCIPNDLPLQESHATSSLSNQIRRVQDQVKRLQHLASRDSLTGLKNLRALKEIYGRQPRENGWLVVIDVDNFKSINDSLGHAAGDRVLKRVAEILETNVRSEDTVARIGGDEFVILFGFMKKEIIKTRLESIRDAYRTASREFDCLTSLSIGAVQIGADEVLESAVVRADKAMYATKRNGKNGYTLL